MWSDIGQSLVKMNFFGRIISVMFRYAQVRPNKIFYNQMNTTIKKQNKKLRIHVSSLGLYKNARKLEQFGPAHRITRCYLTSHNKVASALSAVIQSS